MHQIATEAIKK